MIHIFTGNNSYEVKRHVDAIIQKFIQQHGDLAVERLDGEDNSTQDIVDATQSVPFLSSHKLIVISNASSKELLEAVATLEVAATTELVVVVPKVDRRAAYYKKLSKLSGFKNFDASKVQNIPAWVTTIVKDKGGSITTADAQYLVDRVGQNQLLISQEIDKLISYNPKISKRSIQELCEPLPQTSVFQLLDAAFNGNIRKAEEIYQEQRTQKVEPHAILGMIAWQLHILAVIKTARNSSVDVIAGEAKLNPFVVKKSMVIAQKLSLTQLELLVRRARDIDVLLKSKPVDADQAMQGYLLLLALRD